MSTTTAHDEIFAAAVSYWTAILPLLTAHHLLIIVSGFAFRAEPIKLTFTELSRNQFASAVNAIWGTLVSVKRLFS